MHKVKGLEFDVVIMVPSQMDLPYKRSSARGFSLGEADFADMDEEKRLMFVACTRARKALYVYTGPRERSLMERKAYQAQNRAEPVIYESNPELGNYHLNFNANDNFSNFDYIKVLPDQTPVTIKRGSNESYCIYDDHNVCIGKLAYRKSAIVRAMKARNLWELKGFYVSDIVAWTYDDTVKSDEKNGSNYKAGWKPEASQKGYIYIPIISGIGKIN